MFKTVHCAVFLGIALVACTAGMASTSTGSSVPQQQAEVTSPTSGLHVTASIAAVTLGEECGGGSGGVAKAPASGDCAEPVDSGASDGGGFAGRGGCGGYCQQSNVQIAFSAGAGSQAARIEIVRVELLDSTGSIVDTLTASKPQAWNGGSYAAWDQTVKPAGDTKTSYDLTAPAWSKIDSSGTSRSYSAKYKLHVTLRIDGVEITLESTDLSREPAVAT